MLNAKMKGKNKDINKNKDKGTEVPMKKRKPYLPVHSVHNRMLFSAVLFFTSMNILSWNVQSFTDWYRLTVFPVWTGTLGRFCGLFSGSVGEILIAAGVVLAAAQVFFLPVFAGAWIGERRNRAVRGGQQGNPKISRICLLRKWDLRLICWILVYIYGTETLNCYMMYHASTIEEQYFDAGADYGVPELVDAYEKVVAKANVLAGQVVRDADGQAVYGGTDAQLYAACKKAMQAQGEEYPYLSGYYPDPKPIRASAFMSQQYLLGIYFPFTMEANYNTVMQPVNVPATVCHEYSHVKGMILEDEANFLGFVACIESEDPFLQYSGYLSVLSYLAGQIRKSVPKDIRAGLEQAAEQVIADDAFLTQEQWERVEEKAVVPTEAVNRATDVFLETNLTMNGVADGVQSYGRVVRLVLGYYQHTNQVERKD